MDPRSLVSSRYKTRNSATDPKFDTDSCGLSPKATGLHLVGGRGDTLTSTLSLPANWANIGGSNGGPSNFASYTIKMRNLARGSQV